MLRFSTQIHFKVCWVYYAFIEKGCFDDFLDAAPRAKKIRVNGVTTFLLHVDQSITFNQTKFVTETLIFEARLKELYSRLGFKVIKDFATSPTFEKARKRFNCESEKYALLQKKKNCLQFYQTIPLRVTILYDNLNDINEINMCSNI